MILLVKNLAEYDQPITMHTGEEKSILAGSAIRINIGSDKRLMSFYASLISSNFDVEYLQASSQEINQFNDVMTRLKFMRDRANSMNVLQDSKEYPSPTPKVINAEVSNGPVTLLDNKSDNLAPKRMNNIMNDQHVTIIDSKLGEVIQDLTPILPEDYPENPAAEAEVRRLEEAENKLIDTAKDTDSKWYALDELSDNKLKEMLLNEFEETTKLRSKSKIIYHIIELADDEGKDVYELIDKYQG